MPNPNDIPESERCRNCKGLGSYSFPEASGSIYQGSGLEGEDGWFTCEYCKGTGRRKGDAKDEA